MIPETVALLKVMRIVVEGNKERSDEEHHIQSPKHGGHKYLTLPMICCVVSDDDGDIYH